MSLCAAVMRHAGERPTALAVAGPDGELTYGELNRLAGLRATRVQQYRN